MNDCLDIMEISINKAKLPMILVDSIKKNIIDANDLFVELTEFSKDQIVNKRVELLFDNFFEEEDKIYADLGVLNSTTPRRFEVQILTFEMQGKSIEEMIFIDRTSESVIREKLSRSEYKFHQLLKDIPSISVQGYNNKMKTIYWNKASEVLYGYSEEEALGQSLLDLIIPGHMREAVEKDIKRSFDELIPPEASELQLKSKSGSYVEVFSSHSILSLDDKEPEMFCIDIDISERKIARQLRLAASVFSHAMEPILITDNNGIILEINDMFTKTFGYTSDEVTGKNPRILKSGLHNSSFYGEIWNQILSIGSWSGEIINQSKYGLNIPMQIRINAVKDTHNKVQNYICFYSDLTYIKKHQEELENAAYFDLLTGLPNRLLLYRKLMDLISKKDTRPNKFAILYLDLDGFKLINDSYGHNVGDEFLREISKRMLDVLRENDTLSRLGGDEFVVIVNGFKTKKDIIQIVERLLHAARSKININGTLTGCSASIGISFYPVDGEEPDTLLRLADKAMYISKNNGKNKYVMHK